MGLLDALQWHLSLDEASATATAVDAVAGLNFSVNGTPLVAAGRVGPWCRGSNDPGAYLTRVSSAPLTPGGPDNAFAIGIWVFLLDKSRDRLVLSKFTASPPGSGFECEYQLAYVQAIDRWQFAVGNGAAVAGVDATTLGSPPTGAWVYLGCWHDPVANTLHISANGGPIDTAAWAGGTQVGVQPAYLLKRDSFGEAAECFVDNVDFWHRTLTAGDLTELYNGGVGLPFASYTAGGVTAGPAYLSPVGWH